jgi:hypothetical protein
MIKLRPGFLIAVILACAPPCAFAQGTSQQTAGVRSGYGKTSSSGATSQGSTNSPSGSTSRSSGAGGQGRSEGALGMTPQLQKELGIKQQ